MTESTRPADPWRQHVVTRHVLARWAVDGFIIAHDLWHDAAALRSPRSEGYVPNFVAEGSSETEAIWKRIEDAARPALDRLADSALLEDEGALVAVKDLLALHMARSKTAAFMWHRALSENEQIAELERLIHEPWVLDAVFEERTGLKPAGPGARFEALRYLTEEFDRRLGAGGLGFREALLEQLEKARRKMGPLYVEIGTAIEGDLLIGDAPLQTYDKDTGNAGFVNRATFGAADYIGMPIDPRHTVSLVTAAPHRHIELPRHAVDWLNQLQLVTALTRVYYRPASDLGGIASTQARLRMTSTSE